MSRETYFTSGMATYPNSTGGLSVMPGASNNYGSWTELVSSTSNDILVNNVIVDSAGVQFLLIQIGIGSSGAETVVATMNAKPVGNSGISNVICINPYLFIPSGSRLAVRMISNVSAPSITRINLFYIPISNVINPVLSEVSNPTGAVVSDSGNSATSFKTNLTQTTDNFWKDAWCKITSGALAGQVKQITGYNGTTKFITVAGGYTDTPAAGVTFELINQ